jgi:hypothetical protein
MVKPGVIVLILAIVGMVVLATVPLEMGAFSAESQDTSAKGYTYHVEFTKDTYAVSWKSGAKSEDISFKAQVMRTATVTGANVLGVRFNLYLNNALFQQIPSASTWIDTANIGFLQTGKFYDVAARTITVQGELVGKLVVKAQFRVTDVWPYPDTELERATDGAELKSGVGSIECYLGTSGVTPTFEVGSTVKLLVNTGYSGGRGWEIEGVAPPDRGDITFNNPIHKLADGLKNKIIEVKVGADWFKAGSTNEYQFHLNNCLFDSGFTQAFVVDDLARVPKLIKIEESNNGNSFTYTVTCERTYAELDHISIWAWYGYGGTTMPAPTDTESWIIYAGEYSISGNIATITITPKGGLAGTVCTKIVVYDVDGRASDQHIKQFVTTAEGETDKGGNTFKQPFIWSNAVYIVLIIGIGGSLVAGGMQIAKGSMESGFTIIGVGAMISGGVAYFIGISPGLAFIAGAMRAFMLALLGVG